MYFSGYVHGIRFEDPSKGFYILTMDLDQKQKVEAETELGAELSKRPTVKGHINGMAIQVGAWFGFNAKWITHKTYGKQLQILKAPVFKDGWTPETVRKLLVAHGVGSMLVQQVWNSSGEGKFLATLADPKALKKIPGLDEFSATFLHQRWQTVEAYFRSIMFLGDLGLPAYTIRQVWAKFGDDAEKVLSMNPWALVAVDGIPFKMADEIAMKMGLDEKHPGRATGAVLAVSRDLMRGGHLYGGTKFIYDQVKMMVGDHVDTAQMTQSLVECHKNGDLVIDKKTKPGVTAIYTPWALHVESESSEYLADRTQGASYGKDNLDSDPYMERLASMGPETRGAKEKGKSLAEVIECALKEWGEGARLTLSDKQKRGVLNALSEPVSLLIGLPGTGKTTSLRAAVRIFQEAGISFTLCAPTGIAAKNLSARTGAPASTIHRAFAAQGSSDDSRAATYAGIVGKGVGLKGDMGKGEPWGYDPEHPHHAEVLVIDESSMMDQHLLYRVLTCTSRECRLVIVGDAAQLPSVGPGNVLRDMVESGRFPTVNLTEIFRQEDTSDIIFAAHDIHAGKVPDTDLKSDFSLVPADNEEKAQEIICKVAAKLYKRRANFQILSPRHAGTAGVTNLNTKLRELLNPQEPGKLEVRLGKDTFRVGDRMMVTKNNYKYKIFNGDVGKIDRIHRRQKEMDIKIFGATDRILQIPFSEVPRLIRLAYACTVHKAQGLEYDVILMPVLGTFRHQLQRNLFYTAITRAKVKVILVGERSALGRAVANDKEDQRNTLFRQRLENLIPSCEVTSG